MKMYLFQFMDIHHAANRLRQKRQNEIDATREGLDDAGIDGLADLAQAALIKVRFHSFVYCNERGEEKEKDKEKEKEKRVA